MNPWLSQPDVDPFTDRRPDVTDCWEFRFGPPIPPCATETLNPAERLAAAMIEDDE